MPRFITATTVNNVSSIMRAYSGGDSEMAATVAVISDNGVYKVRIEVDAPNGKMGSFSSVSFNSVGDAICRYREICERYRDRDKMPKLILYPGLRAPVHGMTGVCYHSNPRFPVVILSDFSIATIDNYDGKAPPAKTNALVEASVIDNVLYALPRQRRLSAASHGFYLGFLRHHGEIDDLELMRRIPDIIAKFKTKRQLAEFNAGLAGGESLREGL